MIIDNWTDVSLTNPNNWAGPQFTNKQVLSRETENWSLGPRSDGEGGILAARWHIRLREGKAFLYWNDPWYVNGFVVAQTITDPSLEGATWPSLAFDQLGRPVATWMSGGMPWLYWYNPLTGANETRSFPQVHAGSTITSVTIAIDYPYADGAVTSNLRMFFLNTEGRLFTAKQSDRYDIIEDTGYSFPAGTFLVGGGLRKDNSFGLRACKVTKVGV